MVGEAFAGLSAIKTAFDIAKGLKDIDDAARRNAAVIELQEKLLTAQATQSTLVERIRDLEKEVASFEQWEATKERYELKKTASGGLAWFLKVEAQGSEAPHQICTKCYEERKRNILQPKGRSSVGANLGIPPVLYCPACKCEVLA
jgi:uncharacterized coiled-coil DUF342 family protein